jgi:cytochrome c55X
MSDKFLDRLLHWSLVGAIGLGLFHASELLAAPDDARAHELVRLVREDCGSCHGLTLAGGLGPALLPATLQRRSPEFLVATVLNGRPGTAMPGWARFMSEDEARWVVDRLQRGFPELYANDR